MRGDARHALSASCSTCSLSIIETQNVVLNNRNFSIYTGTSACIPHRARRARRAWTCNRAPLHRTTTQNCSIYFRGACPNNSVRLPIHAELRGGGVLGAGERPTPHKQRAEEAHEEACASVLGQGPSSREHHEQPAHHHPPLTTGNCFMHPKA